MIGLLLAVLVASLLGSMHCVGMCGPLALWASGAGGQRGASGGGAKAADSSRAAGDSSSRGGVWPRLLAYHAGRLLTYSIAGLVAGLLGAAVSLGGDVVGIQSLAARVVGGAMIALGLIRYVEWQFPQWMRSQPAGITSTGATSAGLGGWISAWVAARRPQLNRLPLLLRGVAAGSLTTLLPCGWLYLFVLVAAGTGHPLPAVSVMVAFWLGTLPALTALVAGSFRLAPRFGTLLPLIGAMMLLTTGLYTATGRAAADLTPLAQRAATVARARAAGADAALEQTADGPSVAQQTLDVLSGEPLPCCEDAN